MPVKNASRFLRAAIESVLKQTEPDVRLLCIDDHSTDGTLEQIHELARAHPGKILALRNHASGVTAALNQGLRSADAKYIARMDSDDIALPNRFARQISYLESHPNTAAVGSDIVLFGGRSEYIFQPRTPAECRACLPLFSPIAHPAALFRAELVSSDLSYDERIPHAQDYELFSRIAARADLGNLPEPALLYRVHPGQVGRTARATQTSFANAISVRNLSRRFKVPQPTRPQAIFLAALQVKDVPAPFRKQALQRVRCLATNPIAILQDSSAEYDT